MSDGTLFSTAVTHDMKNLRINENGTKIVESKTRFIGPAWSFIAADRAFNASSHSFDDALFGAYRNKFLKQLVGRQSSFGLPGSISGSNGSSGRNRLGRRWSGSFRILQLSCTRAEHRTPGKYVDADSTDNCRSPGTVNNVAGRRRSSVKDRALHTNESHARCGFHPGIYERTKPQQGVRYFVSGAAGEVRRGDVRAGSSFTDASFDDDNHFMVFEIVDTAMRFQAISGTGAIVDSGSFTRD